MATVIPATIVENTRADYRRTLTELFLKESNGVAGAPSKYEYQVETDNAGNTIYLRVLISRSVSQTLDLSMLVKREESHIAIGRLTQTF